MTFSTPNHTNTTPIMARRVPAAWRVIAAIPTSRSLCHARWLQVGDVPAQLAACTRLSGMWVFADRTRYPFWLVRPEGPAEVTCPPALPFCHAAFLPFCPDQCSRVTLL